MVLSVFLQNRSKVTIFFLYMQEKCTIFLKKSYFYTRIPHCEVQDS